MKIGDRGILRQSNNFSYNAVVINISNSRVYFEDRGTWIGMPYRSDDISAPYVRCLPKNLINEFAKGKLLTLGAGNRCEEMDHPAADSKYDVVSVVEYIVKRKTPIVEYNPDRNKWEDADFPDLVNDARNN